MSKKHVARVGLDYPSSKTGKPIRVEPGEEVTELVKSSLEEEIRAGNILVVEEPARDGEKK